MVMTLCQVDNYGPNYFPLDSNAVYDIHITNDGNVDENLTFRFQMEAALTPFTLTVGGESVDVPLVNVGPFGHRSGTTRSRRLAPTPCGCSVETLRTGTRLSRSRMSMGE